MLLLMEWMYEQGLTPTGGKWISPWQPNTPLDGYHHGWRGLLRRKLITWASVCECPYGDDRVFHGPAIQLNNKGEQFIKEFIVSAMADDDTLMPRSSVG